MRESLPSKELDEELVREPKPGGLGLLPAALDPDASDASDVAAGGTDAQKEPVTRRVAARRPGAGRAVAGEMRATIEHVRRRTDAAILAGADRPRVFVAEWIDPPFVPGHWLPEMIEAAGGEALLGEPGRPSHPTTWDKVAAADPEVVVIAPCGFDVDEAVRRSAHLDRDRIAPNARWLVVDGDDYYSRPGPRLAEGVRQLGTCCTPTPCRIPVCR